MLLVVLFACLRPAPLPGPVAVEVEEVPIARTAASAGVTHPGLQALLEEAWETTMRRSPVWATSLGDHRFDDRLGDVGPAARAEEVALRQRRLDAASRIGVDDLGPVDRTTLELFVDGLRTDASLDVCRFHQWSLSARSNGLGLANWLSELHVVEEPGDLQPLLARYSGLPGYLANLGTDLRAGVAAGRVPNATSVTIVVEMLDAELAKPIEEWAMAKPGMSPPEDWSAADRARAGQEVLAVLTEAVRPALQAYRDLIADEVLPAARPDDRVGLSTLPDGDACYRALIRSYTSLDLAADELHRRGLADLEAVHAEFRTLGAKLWKTEDLPAIFERLRTDPALYFTTAEEVEAKARAALAVAKAAMPKAFGVLPRADCIVEPIPAYEAPYTTIAYYRQPNPDGSRPGTYYVNTFAPDTRPRHEAEVLAFHEAIPGHHLQLAIAQELDQLPLFRRHMGMTAFVEGWALYTERLADEIGLYTGDLDRMGMLSFDAWRASRLVVDTGLHAKGWSREQAERFMLDNTPLAPNNIRNEVDRYINTPGQALAYKTGQHAILDLRAEAEAALGKRFDLAAFHDVVLGGGAVSLPVLQRRVREWIERRGPR